MWTQTPASCISSSGFVQWLGGGEGGGGGGGGGVLKMCQQRLNINLLRRCNLKVSIASIRSFSFRILLGFFFLLFLLFFFFIFHTIISL